MQRIQSIVVPTDFSPLAEAAAARAGTLARLDGAAVHLVHAVGFPLLVSPYDVSVPGNVWESVRQAASESLERARKALEASGVQRVTAEIASSEVAVHAIADAVEAHRADLVVMGTHGHGGLKHAFLGSVAERTLRSVDRPILVVKEDPETAAKPIEKILLAVDFSPHSDRAVETALELGERLSASVDVVHAFDLPREYNPYLSALGIELQQKLEATATERLESLRERFDKQGIPVTIDLRRGSPSEAIAATARENGCQLIVMGTRGNTGLSHILLGSVAERTLRAAPCSVLCVKAQADSADA